MAVSHIIYIPSVLSVLLVLILIYSFKEIQSKTLKILSMAQHQM